MKNVKEMGEAINKEVISTGSIPAVSLFRTDRGVVLHLIYLPFPTLLKNNERFMLETVSCIFKKAFSKAHSAIVKGISSPNLLNKLSSFNDFLRPNGIRKTDSHRHCYHSHK